MAETDIAGRSGRNGHETFPRGEEQQPAPQPSLLKRALREVADQAQRRIPRADLDERDPDYIRERLPLMWLAGKPLVPRRGQGAREHSGVWPGAARRQPLRREHDA